MTPSRITYEYPFHEGIRTMLRLEHLFARLNLLVSRDEATDHHFALVTLFEIVEVASRADLKSDLLKELEKQKSQMEGFRGHPSISEAALDQVIGRIQQALSDLNQVQGKAGQSLASVDWLNAVRSRISIPGGTCSFDLPGYHAWQQEPPELRRRQLGEWLAHLQALNEALTLLLGLLRDAGTRQRMHAPEGVFQQRVPEGRSYQLLRVSLPADSGLVPEITGHRLMVSVRMMQVEPDGKLKPSGRSTDFEMSLCA